MTLSVLLFCIFSSQVHNYIKSFHIGLNMLDHQFTSTVYNCTKIQMGTGKEVVTSNQEIAKIFVNATVSQVNLSPGQGG